jgi:histidinol-phosphate/aromatic aminotransferase/cobyric acid decarboxylase-like protein
MKAELEAIGVSKTVYGYLYPEVEEVMARTFRDPKLIEMQRRGYTQRQDSMGLSFLDTYREWTRDVLNIDAARFCFVYPCAGSAEAIRESIAVQSTSNRASAKTTLHMFDGDYEGYVAYARAHGVNIVLHERDGYTESLGSVAAGDTFYISQPSAIDGNLWRGYDGFMTWLEAHKPTLDVFVDLAYLGTLRDGSARIATHYKNIRGIFFSLSKAFGIFYQRIGGMFSNREWPSLYANRLWFKNLVNLTLGEELMRRYPLHALPAKYHPVQMAVVAGLRERFGDTVEPSDSILLAHQGVCEPLHSMQRELCRTRNVVRYCLTPGIDQRVSGTNPS